MNPSSPTTPEDAPFASTRGRAMALAMAVLSVLVFSGVAVFAGVWSVGEGVAIVALGVALGAALLRWALVRAEARAEGLWVRNLFTAQTVPWSAIVGVRFPDGDAFAQVVLDDGDALSVMAIQRADGARAQSEAQRLANVVARRQGH